MWCEKIMREAMFAVVAEGGAGASPESISQVKQFFAPSVDHGMRMMKAAQQEEAKETADKTAQKEPTPGVEGKEGSDSSDDDE